MVVVSIKHFLIFQASNTSHSHLIHPNMLALMKVNIIILQKSVSHFFTMLPYLYVSGHMLSKAPFISLITCPSPFSEIIHHLTCYFVTNPNTLYSESLVAYVILGFNRSTLTNSNPAPDHVCISIFHFLTIPFFVLILIPIGMLSSLSTSFPTRLIIS